MQMKRGIVPLVVVAIILFLYFSFSPVSIMPETWQTYSTPDEVSDLTSNILMEESDGILTPTDVYRIQNYISRNIDYHRDDPKMPTQTLSDGYGDCFDVAILEYSMLLSESGSGDDVFLLYVNVTEDGTTTQHASVLVDFHGSVILSDPTITFPDISSICKQGTPEEAVYWIESKTTIEDYQITRAMNHNISVPFSSNYEFYTYFH